MDEDYKNHLKEWLKNEASQYCKNTVGYAGCDTDLQREKYLIGFDCGFDKTFELLWGRIKSMQLEIEYSKTH